MTSFMWSFPTSSGHGAMPGTKKMPDLELILKVVMPWDPTFHFRNYVYIRLIVTKLGILKGVTSCSHTITNTVADKRRQQIYKPIYWDQ